MLAHAFYVDSKGFMLTDLMALGGTFADRDEQVLDFFVVDLHHGHHDLVFLVFIIVGCYAVEYLFARNGDDSLHIMKNTLLVPYPTIEYDLPAPVWP